MRIENVSFSTVDGMPRVSAHVVWEDCDRPVADIYFETLPAFADALSTSAESFLAASVTPALWAGEQRIHVDTEVCPELVENLETVSRQFQHWFDLKRSRMTLDVRQRPAVGTARKPRRAAVFFSGGLDSLAACRANRLRYTDEHPRSIKDGIIVFGLEVESRQAFGYVLDMLTTLACDMDIALIPVFTNVRALNPDWGFWYNAHMGPALCAVAHALGRRLSSVTIASDYDLPHLVPHGSHPMVEPYFSSYNLRVHYDGLTRSRLEKARLIGGWPVALQNLRVCNKPESYQPGRLNCGQCEKCVRTMLELMAVNAFEEAPVFLNRTVTPAMIHSLYMPPAVEPYYEELVEPLARVGRRDLSEAIALALATVRGETGLTGALRRFDRAHLNGSIVSLKRALVAARNRESRRQEAS